MSDTEDRFRSVERDVSTLRAKHEQLAGHVDILQRSYDRLSVDLQQMRQDQTEIKDSMSTGFADLKDDIGNVVSGALNSVPEWAARQMHNRGVLLGVFGGLLGAAMLTVATLVLR